MLVSWVVLGMAAIAPAFGADSALVEHRQELKEHYDTNNDGVISASEFAEFREDRLERIQDLRTTTSVAVNPVCAPVVVYGGGCGGSSGSAGGSVCNRNALDRLENVRDRRENVWDRRHHGGVLDRLEDVRDRRENRWDRRH
jgi:hypothetical protein